MWEVLKKSTARKSQVDCRISVALKSSRSVAIPRPPPPGFFHRAPVYPPARSSRYPLPDLRQFFYRKKRESRRNVGSLSSLRPRHGAGALATLMSSLRPSRAAAPSVADPRRPGRQSASPAPRRSRRPGGSATPGRRSTPSRRSVNGSAPSSPPGCREDASRGARRHAGDVPQPLQLRGRPGLPGLRCGIRAAPARSAPAPRLPRPPTRAVPLRRTPKVVLPRRRHQRRGSWHLPALLNPVPPPRK